MGKSKKKKNTKTQLEYIETPFKWHCKPVKCLNERQKQFVNSIKENQISFVTSGPGAGKTFLAIWESLRLLEKGLYKKIVLVRSVRTVKAEETGFLPGSLYDKMLPFMTPFFYSIDKLIGEEARKHLVGNGTIQILPLALVRGLTLDFSLVIFDEAENVDLHTFKSIITRIGDNSKYIICGDEEQSDFKNKKEMVPLERIMDLLESVKGVGVTRFLPEDSAIRNPLIPIILNKLKTLE